MTFLRKYWAILYILIFCMLATFDLRFSRFMTHSINPYFVGFGDRIGILPAALIVGFCCHSLSFYESDWKKYAFQCTGIIASGIAGYQFVRPTFQIPFVIVWIVMTALFDYGLLYLSKQFELNERNRRVFLYGLCFVLTAIFLVSILKMIWGRPRFYSLEEFYQDFHPWYRLSPFAIADDADKSFPSGHTTAASTSLWLLQIYRLRKPSNKQVDLLRIGILCWISLTALSRIEAGMHFISDTMGAFFIVYVLYAFFVRKLNQNHCIEE